MIILTTTSDKIRVKLAAAGTAVQLVACWRDITSTTYLPARAVAASTGATEVDLVASPTASHQLKVDFLSAYNADSVGHTVTFEFLDNATTYPLWVGALGVGESVQFIEGLGFQKLDASGNRLETSGVSVTPYERRWDVSGTTYYAGTAPSGTAESATTWSLTRMIVAADGSVTTATATDSWTNHLTATYA